MKSFQYDGDMFSKQQPAKSVESFFLVLGYGIPKDILKDQNYDFYLRTAFNRMFDECARMGSWNATIIFAGGKTDMWKPYSRVEAKEMVKAFRLLMKREAVKEYTKVWKLVPEMKSLSTLDNFLYVKELMDQGKIHARKMIVFCEQTREQRVKALGKRLFGNVKVHPVDFDQSANRYLDPTKLQRIMKEGMKFDLWALKHQQNLSKHRNLFKEKIAFLRKAGPDVHVQAVREWWDKQLEKVGAGL
jgi:hypothetical protein